MPIVLLMESQRGCHPQRTHNAICPKMWCCIPHYEHQPPHLLTRRTKLKETSTLTQRHGERTNTAQFLSINLHRLILQSSFQYQIYPTGTVVTASSSLPTQTQKREKETNKNNNNNNYNDNNKKLWETTN